MHYDCYALVQSGHAIYGVGTTEQEARTAAAGRFDMRYIHEFLDGADPTAATVAQQASFCPTLTGAYRLEGCLAVVRCTRALYEHVRTHGPTTWKEGEDNRGICLSDER